MMILPTVALSVIARAADLDVSVGRTRIIMREAHVPVLLQLADGSIIADAASRTGTQSDGRTR